jgi:hypothetical protein
VSFLLMPGSSIRTISDWAVSHDSAARLMRASDLLLLCATNKLSQRPTTATEDLTPTLGKSFPCARDTPLQFRA